MHRAPLSFAAATAAAGILLGGCSDLAPGQPGMYAENGAAAGGRMAQAATMTSAESMATGNTSGSLITATVVIIAKHQATERQRQVAQANARAALARIHLRQARAEEIVRKAPAGKKKQRAAAVKTPRYIAVDTVRDEHTAPKARTSVVIFDTQTEEIVGNNVYDIQSAPPVGGTAKFETYTAEYVGGNGS